MKRKFYHYFLLLCLILLSAPLAAQHLTVTGTVTDNANEPMPGVSISVKGTTNGTITGMDGKFSLKAANGSTLLFSFIGYQSVEKKATSAPMKVEMKDGSVEMDEVVVTALGIKKEKKALGYSVTELKGDDMNRVKTSNLAAGLAGKVAGVNVVKPASGAMGSTRITIRGNGSFGSNQPLYVVDGTPIDNSTYGQAGVWGGVDGGDGISSINSEDIESMSVLKGGTAAALYGSRAANGAIVITTKKGVAGKVKVEYDASYTFDKAIVKTDDLQWEYGIGMVDTSIPGNYKGAAPMDDPVYGPMMAKMLGITSFGGKLDGSDVYQFDGVKRPYVAAGRDNFDKFYDDAWSLTNNLSVSGGSQNTQFRISVGDQRYHDLFPNSKLERNNITLNLNSKLTEKFSIQANVMYVRERVKNRQNLNDIIMNGNTMLYLLPANVDILTLSPGIDEAGNELIAGPSTWISNPYFIANHRKQSDSKDRVLGSLQAQYNFTDNWYLRGRMGGDMINRRSEDVVPKGTGYKAEGSISNGSVYNGEFNVEAIAGYTNSFNDKWTVNAFAGWNTMASWYESINASGNSFIQPGFNSINNTERNYGGKSSSESYINSIFAQGEASYNNMLFLTVAARNDWFSSLSLKGKTTPNHILYPSAGLGFILTEVIEMPSWIPYLKLRGSWAESGGAVGPYGLGLTYGYNQAIFGNPIGSINEGTIPSFNLKPLSSIAYEAGFDVRFLNNRLGLDFTYYIRNTHDDIVSAGISSASGYDNVRINAGKINNHGIEMLLTATPVQTRNFKWNTSFNFSYNKSEINFITDGITEFIAGQSRNGYNGGDGAPAYIYQEVGQPYGVIKGYSYERDANGSIVYDKNGLPKKGAIKKLGEGVHPYTLGFSNSFEYKNFTLDILLDGKFGGSLYSGTNNNVYSSGRHIGTLPGREDGVLGEGVKEDGTPNDVRVDAMTYYMYLANNITEEFVYDASFIKLREVALGYNFPKTIVKKIGLSDLRLSIVGRNLWTIYDKVPLVDAESSYTNGNEQGMEMYGVPATRSIGFNLNVKF